MTTDIINEFADEQLVSRAQKGDLRGFETLTSRYERRVYSLALRMLRQEQDAEGVTQQTLLSTLENLKKFRGEASFSSWILQAQFIWSPVEDSNRERWTRRNRC